MIGDPNNQFSLPKHNFSLSRPYFFRDDMTWCVRRANQIPTWKNIYYIANLDIIILGIFLMLVSIFFTYVLTSFEERPRDIWSSTLINIQATVLTPARFKPKRPMLRYFYAGGLLAMLAVTTTFLAFHYDFMMYPRYEKQIDTFNQLVNNNFLLAGEEQTKDYLVEQNLVNREMSQLNHFESI